MSTKKMKPFEMVETIVAKLTKEEINNLVEMWDDGSLSGIFYNGIAYNGLITIDRQNYPEQYVQEENDVNS